MKRDNQHIESVIPYLRIMASAIIIYSMKFYGELLVFVLLFITNLRVFFVHHVRRDPLVMLAPFTFIIAILQIFSRGVDCFTASGLLISFFVLISNFHAIFRYIEALYIDHYSPLMKTWAVFTITLSLLAIGATIYFSPVEQKNIKLNISEEKALYSGSFRSGFTEAKPFDKKSLVLTKFAPEGDDAAKNNIAKSDITILLMPDKRADTAHYLPYLQELACRGITVYSADFYADDGRWLHSVNDKRILRRLVMTINSVLNNQIFMSQREYYTYNISQEYSALIPLLEEKTGNHKFFLITDVMADTAASDFQKKNPEKIAGILSLSNIPEYKTAGYGCIEQTDPLLAVILGMKRDKTLATPKRLAERTEEALNDLK